MIIVHHTGGDRIQGALHEFLTGTRRVSAHYVIDTDGQIVKMVQDTRRASHAGGAQWLGLKALNDRSVGIEIVNGTAQYAEAQYTTLLDLLNRLLSAHSTIDRRKIIGHSDIATDGAGVLGRKSGDPGLRFQWVRLEGQLLGMLPRVGPIRPDIYGGFFLHNPTGAFRNGDLDSRRRFGGQVRNDVTGTPINELQSDLQTIGYSVGQPDGEFGNRTRAAVRIFQEHFFAGGRGPTPTGQVDRLTADMIKMVR
jgi:N-acetyl-anhydromuramyl-L-alanine amidase AmpD